MVARLSTTKFDSLLKSIDWSQTQLNKPREERNESIRQFAGNHYGVKTADLNTAVNFLKLASDIFIRILAPRKPKCMITTKYSELKPTAATFQMAVNEIPRKIGLQKTLKRMVMEALFSVGIVKIGLHTTGTALGYEYGEPFVDNVTLDDVIIDMSAKRMDLIQYIGNTYWLPFEKFMDTADLSKKLRSKLKPDEHELVGDHGERRAENLGTDSNASEYEKRIKLRDVFIPQDGVMMTYAVAEKEKLNEFEWEGPEKGPYHILGFTEVPGNLLPLAPVPTWRDLHELGNMLYRKLGNQADDQKTVLGFSSTDENDVIAFKGASDGDGIPYHGAEPKTLTAGGVSQTTLAFWLNVKDVFAYFAGNLDSVGGLAAQTQTVGQDRLLSEAANAQMQDMSEATKDATEDIFESLAWYEWNDPIGERVIQKPLPGTDMTIPVPWNIDAKIGEFDLFDMEIDVYSMQDDSPQTKLQKLDLITQKYIVPFMPAIESQGGMLDMVDFMRIVAKYADFEELAEIIKWNDQSPDTMAGVPPRAGQGSKTTENIRRSIPGSSPQGNSQVLQQLLSGGNPQQAQQEALVR